MNAMVYLHIEALKNILVLESSALMIFKNGNPINIL